MSQYIGIRWEAESLCTSHTPTYNPIHKYHSTPWQNSRNLLLVQCNNVSYPKISQIWGETIFKSVQVININCRVWRLEYIFISFYKVKDVTVLFHKPIINKMARNLSSSEYISAFIFIRQLTSCIISFLIFSHILPSFINRTLVLVVKYVVIW